MTRLTKSRFISGIQCEKRLWLEVHEPLEMDQIDSVAFINGRAVDRVAQTLRSGTVISLDRGMPAAITETTRLMRSELPVVLYQPAFQAGDLAVIADVIDTHGSAVTLTEVKASTSVKPEHLPDAAFQTLVIRKAGIAVDRVLLAHVDTTFVLKTQGDYAGLLTEDDLTNEVEESLPEVEDFAGRLLQVMVAETRPAIAMGAQCTTPYECPFVDRCWAERGAPPEFPVGLLPRGGRTVDELLADGYEDLTLVPADRLSSQLHQRVQHATMSGEVYFDASATLELRKLPYPMSYLDFETIGFAVPEVIGTHPYEQWPFQWSVHVEDGPGELRHAEYLAIENFADLTDLADALLKSLPDVGPVFAYNASFERRILECIANRLPNLASRLKELAGRLVDLLAVTRAAYYHRDMRGSWSIKQVLPTIAPELDYSHLTDVQEGGSAQLAFLEIRSGALPTARQIELRKALLAYCERDTWGIVVLRRFLCGDTACPPAPAARLHS